MHHLIDGRFNHGVKSKFTFQCSPVPYYVTDISDVIHTIFNFSDHTYEIKHSCIGHIFKLQPQGMDYKEQI